MVDADGARPIVDGAIELMLRVRGGDRAAFAVLYERHATHVHRFFCGLGTDAHSARDLGQETFLRIWQHRHRYAATGSFPAYLFTFARFVWLEHCRQLRKPGRRGDPIDELIESISATSATRPDERAARLELGESVGSALALLPEDQRMAFVLQAVHGLTAQEAASVMQCPANTARSRKILAIKKLRALLQPVWITQSCRSGGRTP
jgi:RNA polymerase sigma-70 factor (ECF subfamily)